MVELIDGERVVEANLRLVADHRFVLVIQRLDHVIAVHAERLNARQRAELIDTTRIHHTMRAVVMSRSVGQI